uniref:(northern house mosquito) hypothetical protein n=1 Tax=Culex pipiens TaxID=7175 RepID=A0A8D8CVX1_CULPI
MVPAILARRSVESCWRMTPGSPRRTNRWPTRVKLRRRTLTRRCTTTLWPLFTTAESCTSWTGARTFPWSTEQPRRTVCSRTPSASANNTSRATRRKFASR